MSAYGAQDYEEYLTSQGFIGCREGRVENYQIPTNSLVFASSCESRRGWLPRASQHVNHELLSFDERMYLASLYDSPESLGSVEVIDDEQILTVLRQELVRFRYSLSSWWTANREKESCPYTAKQIWEKSMEYGPLFAEKYCKEWEQDIRVVLSIPGTYSARTPKFNCYEHFFPLRQFMRWSEEPDDLKYYNLPIEVTDDDKEMMKTALLSILPDSVVLPNEDIIFAKAKTTSSLNLETMKKHPHYKIRPKNPGFSKRITGMRTKVFVYPTGCRDTVVVDPDSLNTITWCSEFTSQLLMDNPHNIMRCRSKSDFVKRQNRVKSYMYKKDDNHNFIYYNPDIRKAGITMPRYFYRTLYEALTEKYGNHSEFERYLSFENFRLIDESGNLIPTTRGVGLGMNINELTLMLCAFEVIREQEMINIQDTIIFNDDQIIVFKIKTESVKEEIEEIKIIDEILCSRFGIVLHENKPFFSNYYLLLENYSHPRFADKSTSLAANFGNAFAAPSIGFAKEYINANQTIYNKRFDPILKELISFWGFEFDSCEASRDYYLGGWRRKIVNYMTQSLEELDNVKHEECGYYSAIQDCIRERQIYKKNSFKVDRENRIGVDSSTPIGRQLGITAIAAIPEEETGPINEIIASGDELECFWDALCKKLKKPLFFFNTYARKLKKITERKYKFCSKQDLIYRHFELFPDDTYSIPESFVMAHTLDYEQIKDCDPTLPQLKKDGESPIYYLIGWLEESNYIKINKPHVRPEMVMRDAYALTTQNLEEGAWADIFIRKGHELNSWAFSFAANPFISISEYVKKNNRYPTELKYRLPDANVPLRDFLARGVRDILHCESRGLFDTILEMEGVFIDDETSFQLKGEPRVIVTSDPFDENDDRREESLCSTHKINKTTLLDVGFTGVYRQSSFDELCVLCRATKTYQEFNPLHIDRLNDPERSQKRRLFNIFLESLEKICGECGYLVGEVIPQLQEKEELDMDFSMFGSYDDEY